MICYHGTPLGGKQADKPAFLRNRHALVSFAYQDDIGVVAECCRSFVLDNGAFTAWRSGNAVTDWVPYYEWVREWIRHPGFNWCLIPDVIDGSENENDVQIQDFLRWRGWGVWTDGYEYKLRSRAVPVWHLHESIERLKRLASHWDCVAFGSSGEFSSPGSRNWWERMHEATAAICEGGQPICRIHGLRMMDPAIFHRLPFASVDSTNVAQNSGREADRHRCSARIAREIIAERTEAHNSAAFYVPAEQQKTLVFEGME